eukprot:scaffold2667_cov196-Alexandrium_tamarense.AAC.4
MSPSSPPEEVLKPTASSAQVIPSNDQVCDQDVVSDAAVRGIAIASTTTTTTTTTRTTEVDNANSPNSAEDTVDSSKVDAIYSANNAVDVTKDDGVSDSDQDAPIVVDDNNNNNPASGSGLIEKSPRHYKDTTTASPVVAKARTTYTSAPTAILGSNSDRGDFLRGDESFPTVTTVSTSGSGSGIGDGTSISGGGGIIGGVVKKWFSSSPPPTTTTVPSKSNTEDDEEVEHDYYHRNRDDDSDDFVPPNSAFTNNNDRLHQKQHGKKGQGRVVHKSSLDGNDYDESLLDNGDLELGFAARGSYDKTGSVPDGGDGGNDDFRNEGGNGKHKFQYKSGRGSRTTRRKQSQQRNQHMYEEEQRAMGECSFFYDGMDNGIDDDVDAKTRPHSIPHVEEEEYAADDKENGYFRQENAHHHYRNRRVNPRAMARAITSTAKRQWMERRYRRRLKQSTFDPPSSSRWNANNMPQAPHQLQEQESSSYELTTEHRQAFLAAHAALNDKLANEFSRNKHAMRMADYGYDIDLDLDLNLTEERHGKEEIRADLTKSSLAIRGGQIRLPQDNVRLVMDSALQPGILSVETRVGGSVGYENYGNGNRYGNINGSEIGSPPSLSVVEAGYGDEGGMRKKKKRGSDKSTDSLMDQPWSRSELSYVLTVDDHLYQRLFREISDSYRLPCGMYYCCHVVESEAGHDHVGVGVAVALLMVVFFFLVLGLFIWPMD